MKIYRNPWKFTKIPKTLSISIQIFWPSKLGRFPVSLTHGVEAEVVYVGNHKVLEPLRGQKTGEMFPWILWSGWSSQPLSKEEKTMILIWHVNMIKTYSINHIRICKMIEVESIGIFISPDHSWFFHSYYDGSFEVGFHTSQVLQDFFHQSIERSWQAKKSTRSISFLGRKPFGATAKKWDPVVLDDDDVFLMYMPHKYIIYIFHKLSYVIQSSLAASSMCTVSLSLYIYIY